MRAAAQDFAEKDKNRTGLFDHRHDDPAQPNNGTRYSFFSHRRVLWRFFVITGCSAFVKIYIFLSKVKYSLFFGDSFSDFGDKRKRKIELDKFEKTVYIATVLNLAAAALLSEKCGKKGVLCRI